MQVHLKRKHWVEQPGESEPSGTSQRMKKILLQQLAGAQAKAAASKAAQPPHKKAKASQSAPATQAAPVGLLQRAKEEARKAQEKAAVEDARLAAVAAYRAQKHDRAAGTATMASLKQLVKRGQAAAAQATAIH